MSQCDANEKHEPSHEMPWDDCESLGDKKCSYKLFKDQNCVSSEVNPSLFHCYSKLIHHQPLSNTK